MRSSPRDPWKTAFIVLLVLGVLAGGGWLLLSSQLLAVRDVDVAGTKRVDPDEVVASADVGSETPLVRADTGAIAQRVHELRLVESAEVTRQWPSTLHVAVTEREPRVSIGIDNGYWLVDGSGVRIAEREEKPSEYPLTRVTGKVRGNSGITVAADITGQLSETVLGKVAAIEAKEPDNVVVLLDSGARVIWGDGERMQEKSEVLAILLREQPPRDDREYDVSAPDTAAVS